MSEPEFVFPAVHVTEVVEEGGELYQQAVSPYVCDLCFDTRVRWTYPERFEIDELNYGSEGVWLACERCSDFIERGYPADLFARSLRSWVTRFGPASQEQLHAMQRIQEGFFMHRSGPRVAFG